MVLTAVEIVVLVAGLTVFLYRLGTLLNRIAANLRECAALVRQVREQAGDIVPGVTHLNRSGKVVARTLPLLYAFAERLVARASAPQRHGPARQASCARRSGPHDATDFRPK